LRTNGTAQKPATQASNTSLFAYLKPERNTKHKTQNPFHLTYLPTYLIYLIY
jgi:hypothetical protein